MRPPFVLPNLKEVAHGRVQNHLQVLEDLEVDQVFKLDVVALGRDAIFSLLPELVRDVVVGETLTVEHQDLE